MVIAIETDLTSDQSCETGVVTTSETILVHDVILMVGLLWRSLRWPARNSEQVVSEMFGEVSGGVSASRCQTIRDFNLLFSTQQ